MEPIIVNSQIMFDQYFKVTFYLSWRRTRWILIAGALLMTICFFTTPPEERQNSFFLWTGLGALLVILLYPLLHYIAIRGYFKKIKSMSEPKKYVLSGTAIGITGQTTAVTMEWSNIDKVQERKNDFLIFALNGRSVVILPKIDFSAFDGTNQLRILVINNGIKNNFKN